MKKLKFKAILLTVLMLAAGNSSAYWGENFVNRMSSLSKEQITKGLVYTSFYFPAILSFSAREGSPEVACYAVLTVVGAIACIALQKFTPTLDQVQTPASAPAPAPEKSIEKKSSRLRFCGLMSRLYTPSFEKQLFERGNTRFNEAHPLYSEKNT